MLKNLTIFVLALVLSTYSCKTQKPSEEVAEESGEADFVLPFEVDPNSFMMRMQSKGLADPFQGIFSSAGKEEHLFPIKSTGVSTEPIMAAAQSFINSLSKSQSDKTLFQIQDEEWRMWSNVDNGIFARQGISLMEMDQKQRSLAFTLMQESLSAKGLQLSKDIMKTDQTLREINNNDPVFDEDLYFFTLMGKPSMTEPWGWQIDGHHLVINYFILGDQVVMTPTFIGGEPIITTSGKYKGNTIFQDEQNLGLAFVNSLSPEQQAKAIISAKKKHNNAQGEAFRDNIVLDYEGIPGTDLHEEQKTTLLHLAEQYISNMREGHAAIKMQEIEEHFEKTYFAWIGETEEDAVFYYRIHSPIVLIEFDHQAAVGYPDQGIKGATRNHIHAVVRTPNGNDYGKDLLRQHIEAHHH